MKFLERFIDLQDCHGFKILNIERNPNSGSIQSWQNQNKILLLASGQLKYYSKLDQIMKKIAHLLKKEEFKLRSKSEKAFKRAGSVKQCWKIEKLIKKCPAESGQAYRVFSGDVTADMLVFPNKKTAAMLVNQTIPLGIELYFHAKIVFCFSKPIWRLDTWVKTLYSLKVF